MSGNAGADDIVGGSGLAQPRPTWLGSSTRATRCSAATGVDGADGADVILGDNGRITRSAATTPTRKQAHRTVTSTTWRSWRERRLPSADVRATTHPGHRRPRPRLRPGRRRPDLRRRRRRLARGQHQPRRAGFADVIKATPATTTCSAARPRPSRQAGPHRRLRHRRQGRPADPPNKLRTEPTGCGATTATTPSSATTARSTGCSAHRPCGPTRPTRARRAAPQAARPQGPVGHGPTRSPVPTATTSPTAATATTSSTASSATTCSRATRATTPCSATSARSSPPSAPASRPISRPTASSTEHDRRARHARSAPHDVPGADLGHQRRRRRRRDILLGGLGNDVIHGGVRQRPGLGQPLLRRRRDGTLVPTRRPTRRTDLRPTTTSSSAATGTTRSGAGGSTTASTAATAPTSSTWSPCSTASRRATRRSTSRASTSCTAAGVPTGCRPTSASRARARDRQDGRRHGCLQRLLRLRGRLWRQLGHADALPDDGDVLAVARSRRRSDAVTTAKSSGWWELAWSSTPTVARTPTRSTASTRRTSSATTEPREWRFTKGCRQPDGSAADRVHQTDRIRRRTWTPTTDPLAGTPQRRPRRARR